MKKPIPRSKSEDAEREFWATHDSTDYIDWRKGKRVTLPNLKPSSQTISLRLPKPMLDRLKLLANKRDVPYQSLLKMFLAERLKAEFEPGARSKLTEDKALNLAYKKLHQAAKSGQGSWAAQSRRS
jgi:predicted DNA binding CopG/RHH family protein